MRKILCLTFLAVFMVSAQGAQAFMASAPPGPGAMASGCCAYKCAYTVAGRIATPVGVKLSFNWLDKTISSQIEKIAQSYEDGQSKLNAVVNKGFESQNAQLRQVFSGYFYAWDSSENYRIFGESAKAHSGQAGRNLLEAQEAQSSLGGHLKQDLEDYVSSFQGNKQIATRLEDQNLEEIDPQAIFPQGGTMTKDQAFNLVLGLRGIAEPFPTPNLPERYQDAAAGQAFEAVRKSKRIRSALAEAVLSDIMAGYAPVMEVEEGLRDLYERSGGEGPLPQEEDGGISVTGYLGALIEARFAGQNYRAGPEGLHGMNEAGLLREIATVQALRLVIEQRKMHRAQQMAMLAAQGVSGKTLLDSLSLDSEIRRALTSKQ